MSDLLFQNLDVAQSNQQPYPPTLLVGEGTGIISPTTRLSIIDDSGDAVNFITPPTTGYCEVVLMFSEATPKAIGPGEGTNINTSYTPVQNRPITLYYVPQTALWYVMDAPDNS